VRLVWILLGALVLAQIGYPLTPPGARDALVVATVVGGFALSVAHAALTRGLPAAGILLAVTALGGLLVEALGVRTGLPFGRYAYGDALGPKLLGVPLVIPLAWTWMAWPAWLAAGRITGGARTDRRPVTGGSRVTGGRRNTGGRRAAARVALAGLGLAAWDLFLDPRMVDQGYWRWERPRPALPGVPGVPLGNYLGWLVVATLMMTVLAAASRALPGLAADRGGADLPMLLLYLWTYLSSVLAGAVFLHLPAAAGWTALGMAAVAVPLAVALVPLGTPGHRVERPNGQRNRGTGRAEGRR
jgi:uncharacterized membrane protein